jgi:hypothetical protein
MTCLRGTLRNFGLNSSRRMPKHGLSLTGAAANYTSKRPPRGARNPMHPCVERAVEVAAPPVSDATFQHERRDLIDYAGSLRDEPRWKTRYP